MLLGLGMGGYYAEQESVTTSSSSSPSSAPYTTSTSNQMSFSNGYYTQTYTNSQLNSQNKTISLACKVLCAYVLITLRNSQQVPVLQGTQVMIQVNWSSYAQYLAPNLDNVGFLDPIGNALPAWCESSCNSSSTSSVVWIRLDQSIPALGYGVIRLDIFNETVHTMSFVGFWGESPTSSPIYGEYDNGGMVFNYYDDFSVAVENPEWVTIGSGVTVDNGLTIVPSNASYSSIYSKIYSMYFSASGNIAAEAMAKRNSGGPLQIELSQTNSQIGGSGLFENGYAVGVAEGVGGNSYGIWRLDATNTALLASSSTSYPAGYNLLSLYWEGSTVYNYVNYKKGIGVNDSTYKGSEYVSIWVYPSNAANYSVYYVRIRNLPPNNVMPSAVFGQPIMLVS